MEAGDIKNINHFIFESIEGGASVSLAMTDVLVYGKLLVNTCRMFLMKYAPAIHSAYYLGDSS